MITENLDADVEIRPDMDMLKLSLRIWETFCATKRLISKLDKTTVQRYIYSILLYGLKAATLNEKQWCRLELIELWLHRRILRKNIEHEVIRKNRY